MPSGTTTESNLTGQSESSEEPSSDFHVLEESIPIKRVSPHSDYEEQQPKKPKIDADNLRADSSIVSTPTRLQTAEARLLYVHFLLIKIVDPWPPATLHFGSHYVRFREIVLNDSRANGWHYFAPNDEADTFSAHNLCAPRVSYGPVYYKHGLGLMFHTYLDIVCTAMENINHLNRPPFLIRKAHDTQAMVNQYAVASAISKIHLYTRENLNGRAIPSTKIPSCDTIKTDLTYGTCNCILIQWC
ncbi:gamma-glutamyl phosphate reductase [Striga asiatica]|uniref:Gamma-glutamyl phosphate reductase n=1 Tax=Striga asiatica TaxID=4170 RepID=A0A5A7P9N2_STRAF|nr:gamma-glutamyl phosphate reductase [Striga asiatica]